MFKSSSSASIFGSQFSNSNIVEKLSKTNTTFPITIPNLTDLTELFIFAESDSCFSQTADNMHKLHDVTKQYMRSIPDNYHALTKALDFILTKQQIIEKLIAGQTSDTILQDFINKIKEQ